MFHLQNNFCGYQTVNMIVAVQTPYYIAVPCVQPTYISPIFIAPPIQQMQRLQAFPHIKSVKKEMKTHSSQTDIKISLNSSTQTGIKNTSNASTQTYIDCHKSTKIKKNPQKKISNNDKCDKKTSIHYSIEELKALSKCLKSLKNPVVPCHLMHQVTPPESTGGGAVANQNQKNIPFIYINLSLNEKVTLSTCENAWQPKFLDKNLNNNKNNNVENIEIVLKKVRGILNKLTADNFNALLKEITSVTIKTQEEMQKVMLLIFEKTVSEPNFAPIYAKFLKVLFEEVKADSKKLFKTLLLTRLQNEFEMNVNNADAKNQKLQEIINKINETNNQQERIDLQAELDRKEYQFRRRAWGTVRFIGEMYKLNSLSADRVLQCVESLLINENEDKLEYMCKLLTTVGGHLEGGSDRESFSINERMNKIVTKIKTIINDKKTKISNRVRFMMQDLIDLRSKNWGQKSIVASSSVAPCWRHIQEKKRSSSGFSTGSIQRMSYDSSYNKRHNKTRAKESNGSKNYGQFFVQKKSKSQYFSQRKKPSIYWKRLNFFQGYKISQVVSKLPTIFENTLFE